MTSSPRTAPAEAPSPAADRAAPTVPPNIAALLYVVATLLEYGRHLLATIESRATRPGFSLLAALFGTANLRVILARLHRGILRAAALETLLLNRAASGQDVSIPPLRIRAAPGQEPHADPEHQPLATHPARTTTGPDKCDAPIDSNHLPTRAEIEAEVRRHSFGRTITDISRDFGVVPGLCTRAFWDALMDAIACHGGSAIILFENMHRNAESFRQEQENNQTSEHDDQVAGLYPYQALGFKLGERPIDPFGNQPTPAEPCDDVPLVKQNAVAAAVATGPPPHAPIKLAA